MPTIDVLQTDHPEKVLDLIRAAPMPGLDGEPKCEETRKRVWQLVKEAGYDAGLRAAGLWLLAGDLDLSHEVSQANPSPEGSFWHGIMHRREGDYGNAKYWFRRSGADHPVHEQLAEKIAASGSQLSTDLPLGALQDPATLPSILVESCQQALTDSTAWVPDLQQICWWEWQLLFDYSG